MLERNDILIQLKEVSLLGTVSIPPKAKALIIFAHGSGSSRLSPRNLKVAGALNQQGFATCLFDLLTEQEERIDATNGIFRFDINLLASRLAQVTHWLSKEYEDYSFDFGYFGASTGAAAALIASITAPNIKAIVSRGGRPDLAKEELQRVTAPTLLIVGSLDEEVIDLNMQAFNQMSCEKEVAIVPNASHLFEEPGTLEEVIYLSIQWFKARLADEPY